MLDRIEVMELISWLLVCLEREAEVELFTEPVWKVETVFRLPEHGPLSGPNWISNGKLFDRRLIPVSGLK